MVKLPLRLNKGIIRNLPISYANKKLPQKIESQKIFLAYTNSVTSVFQAIFLVCWLSTYQEVDNLRNETVAGVNPRFAVMTEEIL